MDLLRKFLNRGRLWDRMHLRRAGLTSSISLGKHQYGIAGGRDELRPCTPNILNCCPLPSMQVQVHASVVQVLTIDTKQRLASTRCATNTLVPSNPLTPPGEMRSAWTGQTVDLPQEGVELGRSWHVRGCCLRARSGGRAGRIAG